MNLDQLRRHIPRKSNIPNIPRNYQNADKFWNQPSFIISNEILRKKVEVISDLTSPLINLVIYQLILIYIKIMK